MICTFHAEVICEMKKALASSLKNYPFGISWDNPKEKWDMHLDQVLSTKIIKKYVGMSSIKL